MLCAPSWLASAFITSENIVDIFWLASETAPPNNTAWGFAYNSSVSKAMWCGGTIVTYQLQVNKEISLADSQNFFIHDK